MAKVKKKPGRRVKDPFSFPFRANRKKTGKGRKRKPAGGGS
jgi:hypothetical protein